MIFDSCQPSHFHCGLIACGLVLFLIALSALALWYCTPGQTVTYWCRRLQLCRGRGVFVRSMLWGLWMLRLQSAKSQAALIVPTPVTNHFLRQSITGLHALQTPRIHCEMTLLVSSQSLRFHCSLLSLVECALVLFLVTQRTRFVVLYSGSNCYILM